MDALAAGLLRMVDAVGGMRAGGDTARKQRLDEMVAEGYLMLDQAKLQLPDRPPAEPTYRVTEKGRLLLAQ